MTRSSGEEEAEAVPAKPETLLSRPKAAAGAAVVIAIAGLLAAAVAMSVADGFSFGDLAAADAGERPPRDVSLRVASLLMWQAYANALATGAALGLLLLLASRVVHGIRWGFTSGSVWRPLRSIILAVALGAGCLTLACLGFRMQQVGTQDLVSASALHAFLWAGLGIVVVQPVGSFFRSRWTVPLSVLAGGLWGACFPTVVALVDPGAYVERLFATDGPVGLWAGVGCAAVLTGGLVGESRSLKAGRPARQPEVGG